METKNTPPRFDRLVRGWTIDTLETELAKMPADERERARNAWRETFPEAAAKLYPEKGR